MILSHRNVQAIAYLLISTVLIQSCVAYRAPNYSADDARKFDKEKIKIVTSDGVKHKFDWIIVKDQEVINYDYATRVKVSPEEIEAFMALDPFREITLEEALANKGQTILRLKGHDTKKSLYSYKFDVLEQSGRELYGVSFDDGYSERTVIQKEHIARVYVQDRGLSALGNAAIALGIAFAAVTTYGMIQIANTNWMSFSN